MPSNKSVVITGNRNVEKMVSVQETAMPEIEDDMIIVKTAAHAVNPTDWKHVYFELFVGLVAGDFFEKLGLGITPLKRLFGSFGTAFGFQVGKLITRTGKGNVPGTDISGIVETVGKSVKDFKKGDVVCSSLHGGVTPNGGFSNYVKVAANGTIKLPSSLAEKEPLKPGHYPSSGINSLEAAASMVLGLKTVGVCLHFDLGISENKADNKDLYILIWGGGTATGMLAIQIAKLVYGINIITTASKKHNDLLYRLGADKVIDYHDTDAIEQIKKVGGGKIKYGVDCVSTPATLQSVYDGTEGSGDVKIDNLFFVKERTINTKPKRKVQYTFTNVYLVDGRAHFGETATPQMMKSYHEFWYELLPPVFDKLQAPPLQVLEPGLESAHKGMRLLMDDKVSGEKLVFRNGQL